MSANKKDPNRVALDLMLSRRSARRLVGPPPSPKQLRKIVDAALTVPDHGRLRPWRFVYVDPDARDRFAEALAQSAVDDDRDPARAARYGEKLRRKAYEGPAQIVVVAKVRACKVPEWEQVATAASAGYAVTLAAHLLGLGARWKSVSDVETSALRECFSLAPNERLLGWIHIGHHAAPRTTKRGKAKRLPSELLTPLSARG